MQLHAGQTIAGNMIWHTGNLDIADSGSDLYYQKKYKLFQTNSKPDVDKGEVLNAATVNRPQVNNELTVAGQNVFNPRVKLTLGQNTAQINYNSNGEFNFATTKGADITFPSVSGIVITTGNYPTWSDVGGEYFFVKNGESEIRPNNQNLTLASSQHKFLPFQNNSGSIGEPQRRFSQAYINNLYQNEINQVSYSSSYNTQKFITFENQNNFTHTRISGAGTTPSDIILGFDDNNHQKTRNVILNKPLLQKTGQVIIDQDGKLDFNDLKNNNKVDKSGDTLTGQLLFDGTTSQNIHFKTDNQRTGSIKQTTQLAGKADQNEILFNNSNMVHKVNNVNQLVVNEDSIEFNNNTSTLTNNKFQIKNNISEVALGKQTILSDGNKFEISNNNNKFFIGNTNVGILGNPEQQHKLTIHGLTQSKQEIPNQQNDFTLATTKWVNTTAVSKINDLTTNLSNQLTTNILTANTKVQVKSGSNTGEILQSGQDISITAPGQMLFNTKKVAVEGDYLVDGKEIPNGTNLDTLRTPGEFVQSMNARSLTSLNYPVEKAGNLSVKRSAYNFMQVYITFDDRHIYIRNLTNNNQWGSWKRVSGSTWSEIDGKPTTATGFASDAVNLQSEQTISGVKTFSNGFVFGATNARAGSNNYDTWILNVIADKYLALKNNGELHWGGKRVYVNGEYEPQWDQLRDKPSLATTAQLNTTNTNVTNANNNANNRVAKTGDTMTGELRLDNQVCRFVNGQTLVGYVGRPHVNSNNIRLQQNLSGWNNQYIEVQQSKIQSGLTIYAPDVNITSDINRKSNVVKISNPLDKIQKLSGYTYNLKDQDGKFQHKSAGLIAQEVLEVLPDAVKDYDGELSLNYNAVIGLLVEQNKELLFRIKKLEKRQVFSRIITRLSKLFKRG